MTPRSRHALLAIAARRNPNLPPIVRGALNRRGLLGPHGQLTRHGRAVAQHGQPPPEPNAARMRLPACYRGQPVIDVHLPEEAPSA